MKAIKVAWGIDPGQSIEKIDENIKCFLRHLNKAYENVEVYPIHVTSAAASIYSNYTEATSPYDILPHVEKEVSRYLAKFSDISLKEVRILENLTTFRRDELSIFSEHIEKLNCDFVLLASSGRSGFKRMMLGSFTESFLLMGQKPTFVVNPEMKKDIDLSHALVPLEIDYASKDFTRSILDSNSLSFLKKVHLYHHVNSKDFEESDWAPSFYTPTGQDFYYYIEKAKIKSEGFLANLAKDLHPKFEVTHSVSKEYADLEEIIRFQAINLETGLLLLKSHHGKLDLLFSSSLARQLVRKINIPVLVYPRKHQFEEN